MLCELCKRFLCSVTLAHEPAERDVRRAYIIYEPLYPSVQERLNRFRQGENAELFQRGAEQVVHNVGLYDTRRSSEDRSGDFPAPQQEGTATPGPIEASVDEEDCRVGSPRQDRQREPQENDNSGVAVKLSCGRTLFTVKFVLNVLTVKVNRAYTNRYVS